MSGHPVPLDRRRTERGSASVELVLLAPVLVGLLCLVAAFGRVQNAHADMDAAVRDAARAASLERTASAAQRTGKRAALAGLNADGYRCDPLVVDIDTSGFAADAEVNVTATCTLRLAEVTGMGIPTSTTITSRFSEPIDRFRGTR
jgi:Flp pilus assembly protein TadG